GSTPSGITTSFSSGTSRYSIIWSRDQRETVMIRLTRRVSGGSRAEYQRWNGRLTHWGRLTENTSWSVSTWRATASGPTLHGDHSSARASGRSLGSSSCSHRCPLVAPAVTTG